MAAADVDETIAKKLARNVQPSELGLKGDRRSAAERIQGRTIDFVGISFLDMARKASRSVARVVDRSGQGIASGFMISPGLFMTNNHVFASPTDARSGLIQFDYELDDKKRPRQTTEFELDPSALFLTSAENDLDFTIVAVGRRASGRAMLEDFGFCPLSAASDKHKLGEYVSIVQHPDGDYKQLVLRENQITHRGTNVLHYETDTNPGSSGSPVFNDQWEVVALHHTGAPALEIEDEHGRRLPDQVNEGIRISAIVSAAGKMRAGLSAGAARLLDEAIVPAPERPRPVGPGREDTGNDKDHGPAGNGRDLPVEVIVRINGRSLTVNGSAIREQSERISIDPNYSNRRGFDPDFLGVHVPLPKLPRSHSAARLLQTAAGNPFELKYEHFSVVMNGKRRMAYVAAVNIDGASWLAINRETGAVSREILEAAETWEIDERIPEDAQLNQQHFSRQRPTRLFDRGHLVRRQDPTWGGARSAKRANDDTFHFTNCSTQAWMFNQKAEHWQGLEQYVLTNAVEEKARLSLFNGPVFGDNDPEYRDIQVPQRFWKVLARVEGGRLLATALIADQSEMLRRMPERIQAERLGERFSDMGRVAEFQTSIAEIESLTGLDFSDLRDADTFRPGRHEAAAETRQLRTFSDIDLGGRRWKGPMDREAIFRIDDQK